MGTILPEPPKPSDPRFIDWLYRLWKRVTSTTSGELGLGTMADQDADAVAITGGTATGLSSIDTVAGDLEIRYDTSGTGKRVSVSQTSTGGIINARTADGSSVVEFDGRTGQQRLTLKGSGAVGYGAGAGGTVTQATSKSTPVTINKTSGAIITHNASLGAMSVVTFTVNNSTVGGQSVVLLNLASGATASSYQVNVDSVGNGLFTIALRNTALGALSEAIYINFAVISGSYS